MAVYLRPETAQGIFVNYLNVQKTGRMRLPFGIAQIGKAFRNEIVARQFIFRMREFEQMEMQFFVQPGREMEYFAYWKEQRLRWHKALGLGDDKYRYHAVALAQRHGAVFESLMVYGDAERCADGVLTAVALAYAVFFVVVCGEVEFQVVHDFACLFRKSVFFHERHYCTFHRSERFGQVEHHACVAAFKLLLRLSKTAP